MSRTCEVCGRGTRSSQSRSHSNIATKRKQYLNLQTATIDDKKVRICTKCLKTRNKIK